MTKRIKPAQPGRIIFLSGLFLFLLCFQVINAQESRQLTRDELNAQLREVLLQNDETQSIELIRNHRLFIKPFVDGLVKESISKELKGRASESAQARMLSEKTAKYFENLFGERSLSIGVNYLTVWSKDEKEKKLLADSLYALGTKYRLGNEPDKAIDAFQKVLVLYSNIGDERGEAEVLGGLGAVYFNNIQDYQEALKYYNEALLKREKVDDKVLIGNTLSSIGSVYYNYFKDYPQAIIYLDRAEAVRTEIGDLINLGRTIHVKAAALEQSGQFEKALDYFKKSYDLNLRSGDKVRMAQAMMYSGDILNNTGKYPEALDHLEKSIELYKDLKSRSGEGNILSQVGFVYSNLGDLNTAIEKINEAAEIMKEVNNMKGLAGVYNHFGIVLRDAGRLEKALEYYNLSYEIYNQQEDKTLILPLLSNIGTVYMDLKDYVRAEDFHKRGLQISREINAKVEEAHFLLNLANEQTLLKKLDEAKVNYDLALEIAKSLHSPDLTWRILAGMAEYSEQKGDFIKAVELNDSALKILEGMRNTLQTKEQKASFMASERYVYEDIIGLMESLHEKDKTNGYDKLAFSYAERSKSRVLLDLLSESAINTGKVAIGIIDTVYYDQQLPKPVTLDEIKALCPDRKTVIFEYSVGDSSSCLWVITKSGHKLFKIPARKKLQDQIETIRFGLLDPRQNVSEFFTQAGTSLYQELIKPAEPFLLKKSKLIIIPDGILNYLPFEVLLTDNKQITPGTSFQDIPFLVKKYPVSYGQSASVLKTLISKPAKKEGSEVDSKKLFAFGDPLYEDTSFNSQVKYPRLEFTSKEIENIASFFPGESSDIYLRNKATEENLKRNTELNKFKYIHFATHGLINEDKPDLSSLVLTSGKNSGEDGILQAAEIFNLKLNADLVVLSACQTGLGKLVRGEGMVGLTRAFMYAGTPSVVVSLWSVSDISTAALMGEFYKNLIKNKLSKTDALRKAQLTLMSDEKYAHPFYWAPFILIGDWR